MNLAKNLLNKRLVLLDNEGLLALTTKSEQNELGSVGQETVKLKRTFNMTFNGEVVKFWRVIAPLSHPNLNSDLSVSGLKEWGIL